MMNLNFDSYVVERVCSTAVFKEISDKAKSEFLFIYTKSSEIDLGYFAVERLYNIAQDSNADMLYADHYKILDGKRVASPVIDYQFGSLRDDFDFGSVLFIRTSAFKAAVSAMNVDYKFGALYDLRLKLSQKGGILHVNEYLYTEQESDNKIGRAHV